MPPARTPWSGCIAMCDVDRFKAFIDCFGHPAGDEVLQRLGESVTGWGVPEAATL